MQLAIFDLDGTITRHDTLVPYVFGYLRGHLWRVPRLLAVLPALLRFAMERDRGELKSALIRRVLGNVPRSLIDEWTARFVPKLLENGTFIQARERVAAHRAAGDRMVLMSASPDLYVPAIARALNFDEMVCTGIRWDGDRLNGQLATPNRHGEEKTRCLEALRARYPGVAVSAYGNAASDLSHLCRVEHGMLVNGSGPARRTAAAAGLRIESWK
jgi:phosphatidylglycerophosphatase C